MRHRNGTAVWGRVSASALTDDAGLFLGSMVLVTDITARKAAEDALRESEERYRRIVDTASEGIVQVDPDGSIATINPALAHMVGYTIGELVGRPVLDLMAVEELDTMRERISESDSRR